MARKKRAEKDWPEDDAPPFPGEEKDDAWDTDDEGADIEGLPPKDSDATVPPPPPPAHHDPSERAAVATERSMHEESHADTKYKPTKHAKPPKPPKQMPQPNIPNPMDMIPKHGPMRYAAFGLAGMVIGAILEKWSFMTSRLAWQQTLYLTGNIIFYLGAILAIVIVMREIEQLNRKKLSTTGHIIILAAFFLAMMAHKVG